MGQRPTAGRPSSAHCVSVLYWRPFPNAFQATAIIWTRNGRSRTIVLHPRRRNPRPFLIEIDNCDSFTETDDAQCSSTQDRFLRILLLNAYDYATFAGAYANLVTASPPLFHEPPDDDITGTSTEPRDSSPRRFTSK